jgi:transcriptional regulator with XRE-family HTH domain
LSFNYPINIISYNFNDNIIDMAKLKTLREDRFLTQEELAELVGITPLTISRWENSKRKPRFKSIRKLAKVLNVNPKEIDKMIETFEDKRIPKAKTKTYIIRIKKVVMV